MFCKCVLKKGKKDETVILNMPNFNSVLTDKSNKLFIISTQRNSPNNNKECVASFLLPFVVTFLTCATNCHTIFNYGPNRSLMSLQGRQWTKGKLIAKGLFVAGDSSTASCTSVRWKWLRWNDVELVRFDVRLISGYQPFPLNVNWTQTKYLRFHLCVRLVAR